MSAFRRILHATDFSPASRPAFRRAVALARACRAHADLIVTGTHGRTGLSRAFMGSVAERVVRESRCPVLTEPAHGR